MLSNSEYIGLREVLNEIDDEELFSLLETVTKRMFSTSHRPEAIEKILSCIEKPSDLLRRQKITKKILFNYLMKKGTTVVADWDKSTLIKKCLAVWNSTQLYKESDSKEIDRKSENGSKIETRAPLQMGVEFAKWFFKMLNTLDGFGPQHFWPSCNLFAQLNTLSDQKEVFVSGDNNVANFFSSLIFNDKFYFHANDSNESIELLIEEHGLVKIVLHGILHQHSNCVGIFDSAFGLVKHPDFADTYKIQIIKLKMQVNKSVVPVNYHLAIGQSAS